MQRIRIALAAVVLAVSMAPVQVFADYPQPNDDYVNDFAKTINATDAEALQQLLSETERQSGVEIVVVTVPSWRSYGVGDSSIEEFALNLFNTWGVGHAKENNGVMLLVAIQEREARIQLGRGYPPYYDGVMADVMETSIIPYFKNGEYSAGILAGSHAIVERVTKKVSWFTFYRTPIIIGVIGLIVVFYLTIKGKWGWAALVLLGVLAAVFKAKSNADNKSIGGFGGGSSGGGGATGRW